jgi:peptidoglycan hydrolase CwlO-like protein
MSLEERVAALEKGFVAIQQDLLLYRTETTSTNTLGVLNKVIATQELRYREISENETMLLGMFTSVQKDIRTLQEDVNSIKDRLDQHTGLLTQILARLPEKP